MDEKTKPIKILVLEDSPGDFHLIEQLLSEEKSLSFIVESKERLSTGLERLREGNIDVVLLDLGLPDSSGIKTFLEIYAEAPNIPIIILTGIADDKFALEAVHRGAQDYLVKEYIEPHNMVRAIRYSIERKKIEIELKEANEKLAAEIAERKRIEQALRESEEKWSSLVKNAPDYILIVDRDGTIQFTNSTTAGFVPEDVIGRNIYEFVHPEYHEIHRECIEQIFQKGQADGFEFEATKLDGTSSWFETHLGPIKHNDQVVATTLIATDITKRKHAEEVLESLTHDLGERVKELNCLYSISDLIEKRDTLEEIFQGTVELIPTGWYYPEITCARLTLEGQEFKTENFRETTWKQRSDIAAYGQPVGAIEVAYLEEKPALDEGPFLEEERNLINAIAERLGRIIERMRTRKALTETNQLLTTILDYTPLLIAYLDPQFNFVRVNPAYAKADERDPSFFPGKNHFDLYPNIENEEIFQRVVNTGEPYFIRDKPFEYAEHPERGITYWDWSLIPIKELNGAVEGLVFTLENVTERVHTEEKIKASLVEKEVLLKEIYHRVRNNLQVINSLFSLQSSRIHDEESRAIFEKCKNRVNSIALVHEKLYESKDLASINFGDYIRTLTNQLLNSYSDCLSAVALKINASEVFLEVTEAIPCALIINELVLNSMKYAFPNSQKGEICIELKSDGRGKVSLIVVDNGVGLPPDFDITDSQTLGMQIINALVTQLHGSIKIDRGQSRGAKFTVEFQLNELDK